MYAVRDDRASALCSLSLLCLAAGDPRHSPRLAAAVRRHGWSGRNHHLGHRYLRVSTARHTMRSLSLRSSAECDCSRCSLVSVQHLAVEQVNREQLRHHQTITNTDRIASRSQRYGCDADAADPSNRTAVLPQTSGVRPALVNFLFSQPHTLYKALSCFQT